ncbi:hypothetical protein TIFTF001_011932 [Ficus carica]|uniref:NAC domain-containing protein n=1 Tax=Ficus carica TaxID=3494 RepID=A0AA88D3A3_FICCA|nr:hypothetical protein TIFTF001_011932 [Ficus carica]
MRSITLPRGLPVGFRFRPTDEELITDYLKPKLLGTDPDVDHIVAEIDFCKFEPWELPLESKIESKDLWLFFCVQNLQLGSRKSSKRKRKSEDGTGVWKITGKRTTGKGTWKITGKEREIKDQDTKECIGKKKTLVYKGPIPGEKTNWVMQLYYIMPDHPFSNQTTYVLCRLKRKANDMDNTMESEEGSNEMVNTLDYEEGANEMHNTLDPQEGANDIVRTPDPEKGANDIDNTPDSEEGVLSEENANDMDYDMDNTPDPEEGANDMDNTPDPEEGTNDVAYTPDPEEGANDETITPDPKEAWAYDNDEAYQQLRSMPMYSPVREFVDNPVGIDTDTEQFYDQMPYSLCYLMNKANDNANTPDSEEGKPSGDITSEAENPVTLTTTSRVYGREEFLYGPKVNPYGNYNAESFIQPTSLKRPYPLDVPASVGTDVGGVDGRVKRSCSLANSSISSWRVTPIANESV